MLPLCSGCHRTCGSLKPWVTVHRPTGDDYLCHDCWEVITRHAWQSLELTQAVNDVIDDWERSGGV